MRVDQGRLKVVVEAVTGPAIAILFWFQLIIIVALSLTRDKFWEASFFEAFGAVGQVAFAGAVFWLGWQQFSFTKEIEGRQRRFELHDRRARMIDEYRAWSTEWLKRDASGTNVTTLMALAMRSKPMFSETVTTFFADVIDNYLKIDESKKTVELLAGMNDAVSLLEAKREFTSNLNDTLKIDVQLQAQMLFEIDVGPNGTKVPVLDFSDASENPAP
jgi:hypothetical protein